MKVLVFRNNILMFTPLIIEKTLKLKYKYF